MKALQIVEQLVPVQTTHRLVPSGGQFIQQVLGRQTIPIEYPRSPRRSSSEFGILIVVK